jgi:hypothetical protein
MEVTESKLRCKLSGPYQVAPVHEGLLHLVEVPCDDDFTLWGGVAELRISNRQAAQLVRTIVAVELEDGRRGVAYCHGHRLDKPGEAAGAGDPKGAARIYLCGIQPLAVPAGD